MPGEGKPMMGAKLYLDADRRVVLYAEGGMSQDRRVPGVGWVLADDEVWPDLINALDQLGWVVRRNLDAERDARRVYGQVSA